MLTQPEVARTADPAGSGEPYITTPRSSAACIRSDYEKYGKVIKEIGVKVD